MRSVLVAAGLIFTIACGGRVDDGGRLTVVALEIGGPIEGTEIDRLARLIGEELVGAGNRVEVLVVDGPNADVARPLALPGIDGEGRLDTAAANSIARTAEVERYRPEWVTALARAFADGPSLDSGRDLIGALERAGEDDPDWIVLISTSGGVHRTEEIDFLSDIGPPRALDLPASASIEVRGIGAVPTAPGQTPSRAFTSALLEFWQQICQSSPPTDCEVQR